MQSSGKRRERPAWWNYVKMIIRQYPELKRKIDTPLEPRMVGSIGTEYAAIGPDGTIEQRTSFEGRPSGGTSSPVERCVIHDLPRGEQRKYDAVEFAIRRTKEIYPHDCDSRLQIIDLVYFRGTHTLAGAAIKVGCHENTAGKYSADFIRMVAQALELP